MANERPVGLSTGGPPETVMPTPPEPLLSALAAATTRDEVAAAVGRFPTWSLAWALTRGSATRGRSFRDSFSPALFCQNSKPWS